MACEKCDDVHAAQLTGFSTEPCKCACHKPHFIVDCTMTTSDGEIESFASCTIGGCETIRL
jgi:hypothetical protein